MSSFIYTNFKKIEKFKHKIWNKFLCRIKNFKWKLTSLQQVVTSSNWKDYIWKSTQKKCQMVILGLSLENYITLIVWIIARLIFLLIFLFDSAKPIMWKFLHVDKLSNWKTTWNTWFNGRFFKKHIIYCNTIDHLFIAISLC
jgi:uncharacterized membrane protein